MSRDNIHASAFSKLITLSDQAEYLSQKLISTEQGIANARQRLTGGFQGSGEYDDLRASLSQMVADLPTLKQRCRAAEAIHSKCRQWLDDLPADIVVEPVKTNVDGQDLESVREQIKAAQEELKVLRGLPTSSSDIRQKVEEYVHGCARPQITGTGKGERLKVIWNTARFNSSGPLEHIAEPLALMAFLFPDVMSDALLREIEQQTSNVIPIKDRSARIAALEAKLIELAYVEEALVSAAISNGSDARRSPNALPQAVLQVKIVEVVKNPRTA
jgi:hypothetical protein